MPNFLIVGAMKAGTTTLKEYLRRHDEIFMPPREVHFFDQDDNYRRGIKWYEEFFEDASRHNAVGEKPPGYCYKPRVPERIYKYLPHARLIWILRDPVGRAYSHYWFAVKNGNERLTFESAITRMLNTDPAEMRCHGDYLKRGEYAEQVRRYSGFFPKDQMHFLLLEDLVRDPGSTLKGVFNFLGVDPTVTVDERFKKMRAIGHVAFISTGL